MKSRVYDLTIGGVKGKTLYIKCPHCGDLHHLRTLAELNSLHYCLRCRHYFYVGEFPLHRL